MKKIICLIRHARAMEREDFKGKDDSKRPLTLKGEKKFKKTLKKIKKEKIKIKHSFHSPFLRCKETAKILESVYKINSKATKKLAHGQDMNKLLPFLLKAKNHTAFIGHEPELSELFLLLGLQAPLFKKGELRLVEIKKKNKKTSYKLMCSRT
jgi:phosphohistidine phosphatase SixA